MAALGLAAALAPAQERVMPKGMALRKGGGGNGPIVIQLASESPAALELARDSEAELWLKKAQAAADRSDWKLAIDTLWRVVDQYPIGFVSLDGTDRASTTGACWTLLHRWGADALSAYRTVYEPEAQRLFTEARAAGDSAAMRRIVRRYFPTQAAADALDWLATVELDSGRADEAAARLRRLLERSQPPATARRLHARLAVASALAGRGDEARRELAAVRDSTSAPAEDGDANPLSDELLSEIEKLVARRAAPAGSGAEPALWSGPASLGGGRDRLVAIEPTLSAESPWWLRFDGTAAVDNLELAHECETAPRAPVWQAGADERQLWIRAPGGVVALDAATFDVRWRADIEPRSAATARVARVFGIPQGGRGPGASSDGLTATAWRSVWDDLAGTISVASGLVFAVETPRELELGPVVFHPALGLRQAQRPPPLTDDLNENSLYAFDAQTGKLRWVKGADGPAGDGLAAAHFFAPPVLVNDWLVAPLALGDEFCLAVMNSDGRLVGQRTIRLGTTNHGVFAARAAVQPVVAGGSLLVPTGCGVVISLSTDDFALQWAASYPRLPILASGGRAVISAAGDARGGAPGWASNPPLAAGPVWIIAAPDSDELLALDRVSGAVRWRVPRGEQRFVLGADDRAVFLSGVAIEARSLDDGSALWTREKSGACGRALLVGDRILVPTAGALLTLATGDGHERSSDPLPNPVRPLGNLFSWRDSLYSLTACGVERIADVPRSLAAAKHDAAVEPRSAHALLRLAVLESLQGRLSQAAELLDRARALAGGDASDGISDSINHLWIDTQLSLARGDSPKRRAERVAGACRAAQRPGDRLRAELARLDTLLEAEGRPAAVRAALALAARIGSDVVAPEELLITRAGVLIAERLVRISAELSDEERGALRQAAVQMAESLDAAARMRLADTLRPADLSAALDLRIATDALAAREVESAEAFFMHAAECADGAIAMPALAALVKLRGAPPAGQPPRTALARRDAETLRRRFGDAGGGAAEPPRAAPDGDRLADAAPDADARWALLDARAIGLAQNYFGRSVWTSRFDPLDRDRPFDRLTLVWQLDQLQALRGDASDPRSTWWSLDLDQTDATDATRYLTGPSAPRVVGARFGSAAVVPIHGVHYPVGLLTGRALGPGLLSSAVEADPASPLVVAAGGWFVAAIDDRTLIGWPARDWDGVMWKRFLGSTTIRQLGVADGEVVVIDSARGKALVVRPWSGRLQAQIDLGQPPEAPRSADGRMAPPEPLLSANRLFASDGRSVQAWHAATGRALWQSTFTLPVISLQPLDDARIGVSLANAQFCVLSADDGRVLYEIGAGAEYLLPPLAATIVNGQLVVALRTTGGGPEMTRIAAFDAATGSPSWSRGPLDRCLVNDAMLRGATDYIPILQGLDAGAVSDDSPRLRANFAARRLDTSTYQLLRLRRSDGSWIGQPVALRAAALRNPGAPLDVRVEPDRVLVTFISGYCVVGPATNAGAAEAEPDSDRSTPEDEP